MPPQSFDAWIPALRDLCDRMRDAALEVVDAARAGGTRDELVRAVHRGVGDEAFAPDVRSEEVLDDWFEERARVGPLSVLTEDRGWRHRGPDPGVVPVDSGAVPVDLRGFDHGGPRIAFDPIDGTRNWMTGLRSAWTCAAFAGPGPGMPRMSDVSGGLLSEIPTVRGAVRRLLVANAGGPARSIVFAEEGREPGPDTVLAVDDSSRADHGYFPFFKYDHRILTAIAGVEERFFERLADLEGAAVRNCWDDQYISSAGQLVLLAEGTYRMIADLRAWVGALRGAATTTAKPYDLAGAVVIARSAGCRVLDAGGSELDFPLDAETPVSFLGFVNEATRARLQPHLEAALRESD